MPTCDREGRCDFTGTSRMHLSFDEYCLLNEVIDFMNTGEILSKDKEHRMMIIHLKNELIALREKKREQDNATG